MPAIDVADLPKKFEDAKSIIEMSELTGLAQTFAAQRTEEVKTSVDNVKDAVTTGGQNAVTAMKDGAIELTTAVGKVETAVTTSGKDAVTAMKDGAIELTTAVGKVETAVTTSGKDAVTAMKDGAIELTTAVGKVETAVTIGAERVASKFDELISELRCLRPILERAQSSDAAAASVTRQYEFFKITALEGTDERRAHLDELEKTVDKAIRTEKLAAFLEHTRRWEDSGSSPDPQRRPKR